MKKWNVLLIVLLMSTAVFQGCKKDEVEEYPMDKETFVAQASSSNNLSIQAGNSATENGVSQAVKDYGTVSIAEHAAADSVLVALASSKGIPVSNTLISVHQSNLNILNQFTGANFDRAFAELMVLTHEETVYLFELASTEVNDPDLREYAATRLPALRATLQLARNLSIAVNQ